MGGRGDHRRVRGAKGVGLATACLVLLVATVMLAISLASATELSPEFRSEETPVSVIGVGPQKGHESYFTFTNEGAKHVMVKCTKMLSVTNNITLPNASITVQPDHTDCTIGADKATVKRNGCAYQLSLVLGSSPPTATVNIACVDKNEITIETATCTIHIPPQNGRSHVVFTNTGAFKKREVDALFSVSSITYTITKGCPGQTKDATYTNGTFTEEMLLRVQGAAEQRGFWVS